MLTIINISTFPRHLEPVIAEYKEHEHMQDRQFNSSAVVAMLHLTQTQVYRLLLSGLFDNITRL